jgi:acyl dehydratase
MRVTQPEQAKALIGQETGISDWMVVDQNRINQFADCTGDHQFIHVDEAAAKKTPFGGTLAHGFLTLSLLSKLAQGSSITLDGAVMGVNYGFDRLRFINPVMAGAEIRGRFVLADFVERKPGEYLLTYDVTIDIKDSNKPALVARWLALQIIEEK